MEEWIRMKYKVINRNNESYIIYDEIETKISSEQDMLDIISACFENRASSVIIDGRSFSEEFYDLKTKLLGMSMQKFINYNIRVAFIIEKERILSDRFKELILEINKGINFRACSNIEDAEIWLLNKK